MEALQDDNGDGGMLCTEHPFKNTTPAGGICAFCLQEKLGKLVSSSFPIAVFPSSSSSSPSFRSDINVPTTTTTTTTTTSTAISSTVAPPRLMSSTSLIASNTTSNECNYHHYYSNNNSNNNGSNKSRILYLLGQKKKKKKDVVNIIDDRSKNMLFKRSKSTVTPRRGGSGLHFTDSDPSDNINSPHKRGFWSFLYLQKHPQQQQKTLRHISSNNLCSSSVSSYPQAQRSRDMIVVEENESPCQASFDRKVSRSRSVGCGSRSFSGDFFERISTGFGDCTLRRVESQREGKSKVSGIRGGGQDCIKERVRCGGLFSGFMITSSSSSSSSSSYWANNSSNNNNSEGSDLKMTTSGHNHQQQQQQHSRSKSWGWALASPMRAFSKTSSTSSKKEQQAAAAATNKNQTPNLAAIPSLLSVRS